MHKQTKEITKLIIKAGKKARKETSTEPEAHLTKSIQWPVKCTVGPGLEGAIACESEIGYVNGSIVIVSDSFATKAAGAPAVVAVYTGNFYVGNLRTMMIERDTDIINQKKVIVATRRFGFVGLEQDAGGEPYGCATGVWAA